MQDQGSKKTASDSASLQKDTNAGAKDTGAQQVQADQHAGRDKDFHLNKAQELNQTAPQKELPTKASKAQNSDIKTDVKDQQTTSGQKDQTQEYFAAGTQKPQEKGDNQGKSAGQGFSNTPNNNLKKTGDA